MFPSGLTLGFSSYIEEDKIIKWILLQMSTEYILSDISTLWGYRFIEEDTVNAAVVRSEHV